MEASPVSLEGRVSALEREMVGMKATRRELNTRLCGGTCKGAQQRHRQEASNEFGHSRLSGSAWRSSSNVIKNC